MSGSLRANVGKKDAKHNRAEGKVPCVVYGGKEELHFVLDEKTLNQVIFTPYSYLIDLDIEGKKITTILQDVQYHPVTDSTIHADFLEVKDDKPIILSLPLRIEGNSPGVMRGGKLVKKFRKLKVKGVAKHIPDEIVINISKLEINDIIKVADIQIPNLQMLDVPSKMVVSVVSTRAVEPTTPGK